MKALISPNETFTYTWISSWQFVNEEWQPVYSEIIGCIRVAEVESDDNIFEVAFPLNWVDCPDECKKDEWYFKDNQFFIKQQDAPKPE